MKKSQQIVLVSMFFMLFEVTSVMARTFSGTFAGSSVSTGNDSNGDLLYASQSMTQVRTSLGSAMAQSVSELAPWDGTRFCADGPPGTVKLFWIEYSEVWTFDSQSQLFHVLAPDDESYLCARPDGSWYARFSGVVTGGSGKFSGSAGTANGTAEGKNLPNATSHAVFSGRINGDIN
jgi:hypothetical protein